MNQLNVYFLALSVLVLSACSPIKMSVKNQYQLSAYSTKKWVKKNRPVTLLVTAPDAAGGYQTEQMLYIKKPYELEAFVKNAWVSPPAEMLYPLMLQSLQNTNFFEAVTSNAYTLGADYRLDSQLLSLNQSFLKKPSVLDLSVKVVLTQVNDNKVLASQIVNLHVPCPTDTPYGGVIAANKATQQLTEILAHFVMSHIGG